MDLQVPTAAFLSAAAGLLWIAAWGHLMLAHGVTEVNERRVVLGLTWLDSGRLVAPSLLLGAMSIWATTRQIGRGVRHVAAAPAIAGLLVAAAGALLAFWTQPLGTYAGVSRTDGLAAVGGVVAALGSVAAAVGLVVFAVAAIRARVISGWAGILLGCGAVTAVPWLYETTHGLGLGVAWLGLAWALVVRRPG